MDQNGSACRETGQGEKGRKEEGTYWVGGKEKGEKKGTTILLLPAGDWETTELPTGPASPFWSHLRS